MKIYTGQTLIVISGDGHGAGKTTLARTFGVPVFSQADAIRVELSQIYPDVDWFDKSPEGKSRPFDGSGLTVRDILIQHGQARCTTDPQYWARQCLEIIQSKPHPVVVVDDIRKLVELSFFREKVGKENLTHFHVSYDGATPEPHFDNQLLRDVAQYLVVRR